MHPNFGQEQYAFPEEPPQQPSFGGPHTPSLHPEQELLHDTVVYPDIP